MRVYLLLAISALAFVGICLGLEPADAGNPEAKQASGNAIDTERLPPPDPAEDNVQLLGPSPTKTPSLNAADGFECRDLQVCKEIATGLPLRILPRSFSNVYKRPEVSAKNIARANIKAFSPLYVFAREGIDYSDPAKPKGWYQGSETQEGPPAGWLQAQDVLEWKQALVVSYTHPGLGGEERQRVLMFRKKEDLMAIIDSDNAVLKAVDIYQRLQKGELAAGLISKEPELFVDINRTFYLLPIVEFQTVEIEGDEARLLRLAAAIPGTRGSDTLKNPAYLSKSMQKPRSLETAVKELGIDMVFVMDMTLSMQPYIDHTKQALAEIARRITQKQIKQRIRFGLIGYRDDVSRKPELEFVSKNFTPELVDMETFIDLLDKEAQAATVSSIGFAEEVFAGIETGFESAWNENALHFLVLVGDSSSHPVGHEQNTTGKDATVLRQAAADRQIHTLAIHLKNPLHPEDHALANPQYTILSKIRGKEDESALVEIDTQAQDTFQAAVEVITKTFSDIISDVQSGKLDILEDIDTSADKAGNDLEPVRTAQKATHEIAGAALVEYLGREATPPKDIVAWALDRDITNPAIHTLDVRVLVNKGQLSDLIGMLDQILTAMDRAKISHMGFFEALQGVSGQTMKNPEAINQSETLAESGLLPAFINSLPYRSEVLSLNADMYASMTAEQRATLEGSLRAKVQQYRDINEKVDGWIRLNATDSDLDKVYPLHLNYLP